MLVGRKIRVVDDGHGLTIDELVGNVASKDDRISIAHVKVAEPASEPWVSAATAPQSIPCVSGYPHSLPCLPSQLTLDYDEWMCVLEGHMVLLHGDGEALDVRAGETVYLARGERFRPTFPVVPTVYVPVCLPAFRPDRCIREDGPDSEVSRGLAALHGEVAAAAAAAPKPASADEPKPEVLYHMCEKARWEAAHASGDAYFPPTFDEDGGYTHATAVPSRLVTTANHFYRDSPGDWVCVRVARSALRRAGIAVRDEEALPVGDTPVSEGWAGWVCPHIFGGIPPALVTEVFPMVRDGPAFLRIEGLV
jgi:uncharacterized protein (DUF952 family)/mannose-6-phosphate isomerase-like protein (cupin superfamily)